VPLEFEALLLPPLPTEIGTDADLPSTVPVAPAFGDPDWTLPVEPEASFPPPAWAVPVEPVAEFPLPDVPAEVPTVTVWLRVRTVAAGADRVWLACAVPVEPEAVLPPPTCAVPVEPDAVLLPGPMLAGAEPERVALPAEPPALPFVDTGCDCTVPVDPEALLLPPLSAEPFPVGAPIVASAGCELALADGFTSTLPI
jgi:hypothetical protein